MKESVKICFIVPYFGIFPKYFQLTLNSMGANEDISWLIITDNSENYIFPDNVKVVAMQFMDLQQLVQSKFEFEVALKKPYKLCDFKPAYGYIFSEYLVGYDYWGHCDIDVIFGRIRAFLEDILGIYDKIFELGHMTLYRNTAENNQRFMLPLHGKDRYAEVFKDEQNQMFDEGNRGSICVLWEEYGFSVWKKHFCADIAQKSCFFNIVELEPISYKYFINKRRHQIFWWSNGILTLSYMDHGNYCEEERMYLHLIRRTRNMKLNVDPLNCDQYKIIPHEFDVLEETLNKDNYMHCKWWTFNLHYFEIRFRNLCSKIKKAKEKR